jgi:hypothetical protein
MRHGPTKIRTVESGAFGPKVPGSRTGSWYACAGSNTTFHDTSVVSGDVISIVAQP